VTMEKGRMEVVGMERVTHQLSTDWGTRVSDSTPRVRVQDTSGARDFGGGRKIGGDGGAEGRVGRAVGIPRGRMLVSTEREREKGKKRKRKKKERERKKERGRENVAGTHIHAQIHTHTCYLYILCVCV